MKHCLVVDDSRVIRTVARRIMEELSYSVAEAEDGMEGLRVCREKTTTDRRVARQQNLSRKKRASASKKNKTIK